MDPNSGLCPQNALNVFHVDVCIFTAEMLKWTSDLIRDSFGRREGTLSKKERRQIEPSSQGKRREEKRRA